MLPCACLLLCLSLGSGVCSPQCHGARCRLDKLAASCQSSFPSLAGPRGRQPTVSLHVVQVVGCAGVLPWARRRLPFRHSQGRRVGSPQRHCTKCRLCRCGQSPPLSESHTGPRRRAAHSVTTRGVDCPGVLPPASLPFRHSPGRRVGSPQSECHGTRCRQCRCAASGPTCVLSLAGPRGRAADSVTARDVDSAGHQQQMCCLLPVFRSVTHRATPAQDRAAHKCYDCWCPASGLGGGGGWRSLPSSDPGPANGGGGAGRSPSVVGTARTIILLFESYDTRRHGAGGAGRALCQVQ